MKFSYKASDDQGRNQKGVVEASTEEAALQILDRHGLYVTVLKKQEKKAGRGLFQFGIITSI